MGAGGGGSQRGEARGECDHLVAMAHPHVQIAAGVAEEPALRDYLRSTGVSNLHPVGTCRMGRGPDDVVDPQLRVHGISGLRVADASIMPNIVAGNTNAPSIMIGEKCADMVRMAAA